MAAKPNPIDKPTRGTIETLFGELLARDESGVEYRMYKELSKQEDVLEEKLLANKKLVSLKKRREAAYSKAYHKERIRKDRVVALRNQYLAKGITSKLLIELDKLLGSL